MNDILRCILYGATCGARSCRECYDTCFDGEEYCPAHYTSEKREVNSEEMNALATKILKRLDYEENNNTPWKDFSIDDIMEILRV